MINIEAERDKLIGKLTERIAELDTIEQEYKEILKSGMFWVFFPHFTGEWEKDKDEFTTFYEHRASMLTTKSNLQPVTKEEIESNRCKAYKTII